VRVLDILSDLVASGQTALAAIHDLDLAARYCDRLCLLHEGEIRAAGPPEAVLTGPTLDDAFETETAVAPDPTTGTPSVTAAPRRGERAQRVHVTGGGQTTARVVATLWRAGFDVSLGIVPAGDAAATIADRLGVESVTAPPFEHPGEETRRAATRLLAAADVVVRTDGPGTDPLESAIDRQERVVTVGGGEEHAVPARIDRAVAATLARQPSEADD
jgi:iron complex transport system ATP-binding protein